MNIELTPLHPHVDPRGSLLKFLRRESVDDPAVFGEIYVVTAHPGESRGGHHHLKITEWFCVLEGEIDLELHDLHDGSRQIIHLSSQQPQTIKVPPGIEHTFRNAGPGKFTLLAYSDRPYDPANSDTHLIASTPL